MSRYFRFRRLVAVFVVGNRDIYSPMVCLTVWSLFVEQNQGRTLKRCKMFKVVPSMHVSTLRGSASPSSSSRARRARRLPRRESSTWHARDAGSSPGGSAEEVRRPNPRPLNGLQDWDQFGKLGSVQQLTGPETGSLVPVHFGRSELVQ